MTEQLFAIDVTLAKPVTEAQAARAALLTDFEVYLVKQRGLSARSIYHALRFANRFLDHRFGACMIDMTRLRTADIVNFLQQVVTGTRPYRDKTVTSHLRTFFQYLFARGATATTLHRAFPRLPSAGMRGCRVICLPMGWKPFLPPCAAMPGMARATTQCCCSWRGLDCVQWK